MLKILKKIRILIEDSIITSPKLFNNSFRSQITKKMLKNLDYLNEYGYCKVDNPLNEKEVKIIKKKIANDFKNKNLVTNHKHTYSLSIKKPLLVHPLFTKICTDPDIIELAKRYFKNNLFVADVDARRILPCHINEIKTPSGYSSSHWHRDVRGRQLKLMIYLTDVGPDDSNFSFLPKTHKNKFFRLGYKRSRISDNVVENCNITPVEWYGKSGEAYLFDTNLIHRLRRKKTANIRDSFTVYFTPGQELRVLDLNPKLHNSLNQNKVFSNPSNILLRSRIKY